MKALIIAASVAAAASLAPAMAQAQAQEAKDSGAYVNLGYAGASQSGVHLGAIDARLGYRINKWVGIEAEGAIGVNDDTVQVGAASAKVELKHQFGAYVVGFAPVAENVDLLARIGYGTTKIGASSAGFGATGSDESFNFGVGGQYHFDGVNGVRLDYTRQEFNDGGHANAWSVSYSRRF